MKRSAVKKNYSCRKVNDFTVLSGNKDLLNLPEGQLRDLCEKLFSSGNYQIKKQGTYKTLFTKHTH